MRYATSARWSNQSSFVHGLDARVKLLLLIAFVISIALIARPSLYQLLLCFITLAMICRAARLPIVPILRASLLVVPFVGFFSLILYMTGDRQRAWFILAKSYLSALSVLVTVSSTPMPQLLAAASFFRVPALLVEVTQLIYRYLFVLAEEARTMQTAFNSRAGKPDRRALKASSGMIGVLFSKSYEKAFTIHQSMAARGFTGALVYQPFPALRFMDLSVLGATLFFIVALHFI